MADRTLEPYKDQKLPERFQRWIEVLRQKIASYPCFFQGEGSPEGVVTAGLCDRYCDELTGTLYVKGTATGNTGWVAVGGGGSVVAAGDKVFHQRDLMTDDRAGSLGTVPFNLIDISHWRTDLDEALICGEDNRVGFITDLNKKMQSFATIPNAANGGFNVNDAFGFFRSKINSDIFGMIRGPSGVGEVAQSTDNGATWINRGTPPGLTANFFGIVQTSNGRLWVVGQQSAVSDVQYSDDNGATWATASSLLFAVGTARARIQVSPDGARVVITSGFSTFAHTTQIAAVPPVFTVVDASIVMPAADEVRLGHNGIEGRTLDWLPDSSLAMLTGSGAGIGYTSDWVTFTGIPLTKNILRSGTLAPSLTASQIVYSAAHEGFFHFSSTRDSAGFYPQADLDNPFQVDWEAGTIYGPATFDAAGNMMQVKLNTPLQVAT